MHTIAIYNLQLKLQLVLNVNYHLQAEKTSYSTQNKLHQSLNLMFMDPCIIIIFYYIIPTRCTSASSWNYILEYTNLISLMHSVTPVMQKGNLGNVNIV